MVPYFFRCVNDSGKMRKGWLENEKKKNYVEYPPASSPPNCGWAFGLCGNSDNACRNGQGDRGGNEKGVIRRKNANSNIRGG